MKKRILGMWLIVALMAAPALAQQKKLMTVKKSKMFAERALIESVFGLKVKSEESVTDMIQAQFFSRGQAKTQATVSGIQIEEVIYDAEKDIAKATASITLGQVGAQTGIEFPDPDKKFVRVGFATSSPEHLAAVKAMRVAEIDAYTSLAKEALGFELESGTTVENYVLKSDHIKAKMIAAVFLAELVDYGWDEEKNAFVTLQMDMTLMSQILGQAFARSGVLKVTGHGATITDYEPMKASAAKPQGDATVQEASLDIP